MVPTFALFLAQTQPNISLSMGASRMPVILEKLSTQTGIEFRCGPQLQDEVLFISVKNAPLSDFMREVAHVTHCDWEKNSKGGYDLLRSQGRELADRYAESEQMLKLLKEALQPDIERGLQPDWTPEEMDANLQRLHEALARLESGQESPENWQTDRHTANDLNITRRTVDRLLATTDLSIFASQKPWEYRRYTQNPNQFQFALPETIAPALDAFRSEVQAVQSKLVGVPDGKLSQFMREYGVNTSYTSPLAGLIIALIRSQWQSKFQLRLDVDFCDRDGNAIETDSRSVLIPAKGDLAALTGIEDWGKVKVTVPRFIVQAARRDKAILNPDDKRQIESPSAHEPLGLACDEALTHLSTATHRDIVAALPDESLQGLVIRNETLASFCEQIGTWVTFTVEDGRLLMTPIRRAEAFDLRAKRAPLEAFLKSIKYGVPSLDEGAAYALAQNDVADLSSFERTVLSWDQISSNSDPVARLICEVGQGGRFELEFFGLLSGAQRQRMTNGGISYRELNADQQSAVARWLYGAQRNLQATLPPQPLSGRRTMTRVPYLASEPTFALANGIPASTLITLIETKNLALMDDQPNGSRRVWDCSSIGYVAAQQEQGQFLDPRMGYPLVTRMKVKPAVSRQFHFTFQYLPSLAERFRLIDSSLASGQAFAVNQLPAEWLADINKTLDYYRKMFKNNPSQVQVQRSSPPR